MATFFLTRKAKADLRSIAAYTQKRWNAEQRRIYMLQLDTAFHTLANNPEAGMQCGSIKVGYRKYRVASHIIFYRSKSSSEIKIVRVLHKRMDVNSKL